MPNGNHNSDERDGVADDLNSIGHDNPGFEKELFQDSTGDSGSSPPSSGRLQHDAADDVEMLPLNPSAVHSSTDVAMSNAPAQLATNGTNSSSNGTNNNNSINKNNNSSSKQAAKGGNVKQNDKAALDNMYSEYFRPVNTRRKLLRGEKLYVTRDQRTNSRSWKWVAFWVGIFVLLAAALLAGILAATGIIVTHSKPLFGSTSNPLVAAANLSGWSSNETTTTSSPSSEASTTSSDESNGTNFSSTRLDFTTSTATTSADVNRVIHDFDNSLEEESNKKKNDNGNPWLQHSAELPLPTSMTMSSSSNIDPIVHWLTSTTLATDNDLQTTSERMPVAFTTATTSTSTTNMTMTGNSTNDRGRSLDEEVVVVEETTLFPPVFTNAEANESSLDFTTTMDSANFTAEFTTLFPPLQQDDNDTESTDNIDENPVSTSPTDSLLTNVTNLLVLDDREKNSTATGIEESLTNSTGLSLNVTAEISNVNDTHITTSTSTILPILNETNSESSNETLLHDNDFRIATNSSSLEQANDTLAAQDGRHTVDVDSDLDHIKPNSTLFELANKSIDGGLDFPLKVDFEVDVEETNVSQKTTTELPPVWSVDNKTSSDIANISISNNTNSSDSDGNNSSSNSFNFLDPGIFINETTTSRPATIGSTLASTTRSTLDIVGPDDNLFVNTSDGNVTLAETEEAAGAGAEVNSNETSTVSWNDFLITTATIINETLMRSNETFMMANDTADVLSISTTSNDTAVNDTSTTTTTTTTASTTVDTFTTSSTTATTVSTVAPVATLAIPTMTSSSHLPREPLINVTFVVEVTTAHNPNPDLQFGDSSSIADILNSPSSWNETSNITDL